MRQTIVRLIEIYQSNWSPDHSPRHRLYPHGFCRYYPSCSEYARQAVGRHGVIAGAWLALKRLGRCHPWSAGGVDHFPESL